MSYYLDKQSIQDIISHRDKIFAEARAVMQKYGIDVLANDTLSALQIWEIVVTYDSDYNINFHRNGEDAKSNGILIENKCSTSKPKKDGTVSKSGWQFHAQGVLDYPRYVFAARRKDNLEIVRIWDVSSDTATTVVKNCLEELKQKWIDKGKPNHDAILVPEKLLMELPVIEKITHGSCQVYKI